MLSQAIVSLSKGSGNLKIIPKIGLPMCMEKDCLYALEIDGVKSHVMRTYDVQRNEATAIEENINDKVAV